MNLSVHFIYKCPVLSEILLYELIDLTLTQRINVYYFY